MITKYSETYILSLGGSIIVPNEVDGFFLNKFNNFIRAQVAKKRRFFIVAGGGATCRKYQLAAQEATDNKVANEDLDWLGIHSTRLNAHFIRTIFRDIAHPRIIDNYDYIEKTDEAVIIAAGWKPGWSTDYDAVILAEDYGAKKVVNLSNIDQVYTADPKKDPQAKPLANISWAAYRQMIGDDWMPGLNTPFDPVASKLAQEIGIEVYIINGKKLDILENILDNKTFFGTVIHP